jgi:uncharacterized protein YkwD
LSAEGNRMRSLAERPRRLLPRQPSSMPSARRNHGLNPLEVNARLSKTAYGNSLRMAKSRTVFHTANLYDTVRRYRPNRWGENVGMASTVRGLHRAFMASYEHRANILGTYRKVGIGLVRSGGYVWGTLIFYG